MATNFDENATPMQGGNVEAQESSNNPFDPLVDIVGLHAGEGGDGGGMQTGTVAGMSAGGGMGMNGVAGNGMFARAGMASADASTAERVATVKAAMPGTQSSLPQQGTSQQEQFGVAGSNMHLAANPHLNAYSHAQQMQMQAQWAQQQQAMMQMYSTYYMGGNGGAVGAGYNTMNMGMAGGQQGMHGGMQSSGYAQPSQQQAQQQQLVVYQQGQQMMQQPVPNQMPGYWGAGGGAHSALVPYGAQAPGAVGIGTGASATAVAPAMKADRVLTPQASDFRVKRGTKPTRVNDDDKAFGPLLDELKARPARI